MSGRQQVAPGLKRPTGRQWQHFNISNHSTSKEASFGNCNMIVMQFQSESHFLETAILTSRVPQIPISRACRPQYARRLGMLASQYRGFFGAIRLRLALAHNVRPPPPSVSQTLFLREMASKFLATGKDHPRIIQGKAELSTIVVCMCQPQSHGTANGGGTSMQSPS